MNLWNGKISARRGRLLAVALLAYALILQGFLVSNLTAATRDTQSHMLCLSSIDHSVPDQKHVDCSCPGLCAPVFALMAPQDAAILAVRTAGAYAYRVSDAARVAGLRRSSNFFARGPPDIQPA